jgi:2-polyprenyl-6-methoxyphenol hydroxylase-like FAD-dependent oxidoreductase
MARIVTLGAGMNSLTAAMLLAADGHQVTVLERDPQAPPPPERAWEAWDRPGVAQFRQLHFMLSRWRVELERTLSWVLEDLVAAGGLRFNPVTAVPEERRGAIRPDDDRFETVTARRPVLEAVLAAAAERTPGVVVRRGADVRGFVVGRPTAPGVPHVAGVRTADGATVPADLVVDCRGRNARVGDWLGEIGAAAPVEQRDRAGFVYYGRHFSSADGTLPPALAPLLQHYAPFSAVTLPADNGTWSVGLITSSADRPLRALRDPAAWDAALAQCPAIAHWAAPERGARPITGVEVMAGLQDRSRRLVVDGQPVVTGAVLLGDAWARTNPALGRGTSIGAVHAGALRQALQEVDPDDPDKLVRRFDDLTCGVVEPLYRATRAFDRHRLAELDGEITGTPYESDDPGWQLTKAVTAAALGDPDALRLYARMTLLLEPAEQVLTDPDLVNRVRTIGATAPRYPVPGPTRAEALSAIGA